MDSVIQRYRGVVREFDKSRGHGTIEDESGKPIFVRYSAIIGQGIRSLKCGDRVSFDVEHTQRGANAVHVTLD